MKLDVYVNFRGNCEEAFRFYEQHLSGRIMFVQRHGEHASPNTPPDWTNAVLHAQLALGGMTVMGADVPTAEPMRSAYLTLTLDTPEEAERIYAVLSADGQVLMKMEQTFFANRFGMVRDRFGINWMFLQGVSSV